MRCKITLSHSFGTFPAENMPTNEQAPIVNYPLSVKDFGPVVQADVDLRPLSVFLVPGDTSEQHRRTVLLVFKCLERLAGRHFFGLNRAGS